MNFARRSAISGGNLTLTGRVAPVFFGCSSEGGFGFAMVNIVRDTPGHSSQMVVRFHLSPIVADRRAEENKYFLEFSIYK
jgi:hypothetical protein